MSFIWFTKNNSVSDFEWPLRGACFIPLHNIIIKVKLGLDNLIIEFGRNLIEVIVYLSMETDSPSDTVVSTCLQPSDSMAPATSAYGNFPPCESK